MLLALALVCFVLGFSVAIIVVARPGKRASDAVKILNRIPVALYGSHIILDEALENQARAQASYDRSEALLTRCQVETKYDQSSWQRLAFDDFGTTILAKESQSKKFPCVYATIGFQSNQHRYLFLKSDDPSEPQNVKLIGPALQHYLSMAPCLGSNTSLVIIGAPSEAEKSVMEYNSSFWNMLRGLRILDLEPWPKHVPSKTDDEKWTFCFDGQPVFPVMLTPAHTRRWSRHMSVPVIALQPKWVLDELLSTPEKRESATSKVRKLLKEYDQVEISPDLTTYGAPHTSESTQLCLLDENERAICLYQDFS